jgi:hypothetical protein
MSWFYTIVGGVAVITLIIALTVMGMVLASNNSKVTFPTYQNICPDFWTVNGTTCSPSSFGLNTPSPDKFMGNPASIIHTGVDISNNKIIKIDSSTASWSGVCDQGSWAKTNGIYWDGVANNNTC